MTKIKQSDVIPIGLAVEAACFHARRREEKPRMVREYTIWEKGELTGRYLLTRYINAVGVRMSSLLRVEEPTTQSESPKVSKGRPESPLAAPAGAEARVPLSQPSLPFIGEVDSPEGEDGGVSDSSPMKGSHQALLLTEYSRDDRKHEAKMIMRFWTEMGGELE